MKRYKLKRFVSNSVSGFALAILCFVKTKKIPKQIRLMVENYQLTSTFTSYDLNADQFYLSCSSKAYEEDHKGNYYQSLHLRQKANDQTINLLNVNDDYFPPLIGSRWTSFIGHLAVLALHARAQTLKIVPNGQRYVMNSENVVNKSLFDLFRDSYIPVTNKYLADLEFLPAANGLFENYHLIKTRYGYLETHAFIESVFTNHEKESKGDSILSAELADSLLARESRNWIKRNLDEDFVVIHLRNTGKTERRDVEVSAYTDALDVIQKSGLQIVNIGPKLNLKGSLNIVNVEDFNLQPYLVSKSRFAVTSTSGPTLLPGLFATPNLVTNLTSLGRNMINCNSSTYYLPKRVIYKEQPMNLSDILSSNIAYDEREHKELAMEGYRIIDNTSQELMLAIEWMIDKIDDEKKEDREIDKKVREIQISLNSVSKGRLIPTFLESNELYLQ